MTPPLRRRIRRRQPPLVSPSVATAAVAFSAASLIAVGYTPGGYRCTAEAFLAGGSRSSTFPLGYRVLGGGGARQSSRVEGAAHGNTSFERRGRLRRSSSIAEGGDRGLGRGSTGRRQPKASAMEDRASVATSLDHLEGGGTISTSSDGAPSPFAGVLNMVDADGAGDKLAELKLPELKALYRERGGKPGTLRKPELLEKLLTSVVEQIGDRRRGLGRGASKVPYAASPGASGGASRAARSLTPEQQRIERKVKDDGNAEDPSAAGTKSWARTRRGDKRGAGRRERQAGGRDRTPGAVARGPASKPQPISPEPERRGGRESQEIVGGVERRQKVVMGVSPTVENAGVESSGDEVLPDAAADLAQAVEAVFVDERSGQEAATGRGSADEGPHSGVHESKSPKELLPSTAGDRDLTEQVMAVGDGPGAFYFGGDGKKRHTRESQGAVGQQKNPHKPLGDSVGVTRYPVSPSSSSHSVVQSDGPKRSSSSTRIGVVHDNGGNAGIDASSNAQESSSDGDSISDGMGASGSPSVLTGTGSTNASVEPLSQSSGPTLLSPGRSARDTGGRGGSRGRSWRGGSAGQGPRSGGEVASRPKLMPLVPNPWVQSGETDVEEWVSPKDDVVDEYLMHTMMHPSNKSEEVEPDSVISRENRFDSMPGTTMSLSFLGTASCIPSTSRGVSCAVLRREGDLWMFDVGEGTQIQIQRCSMKPSKVSKIFITHAHGDHSFGLPGLLCIMGQNSERGRIVEVYGPTGLRAYLRVTMRYTSSRITVPYVVHELKEVPYLHGDFVRAQPDFSVKIALDTRYGEQMGGRDIYPDESGVFHIFDDGEVTVKATAMKHGVPCVGYCVEERARPGRLKIEDVKPIVLEHKEAIMAATNTPAAEWVLKDLKSLQPGETFTLPGTDVTIDYDQAVMPHTPGRKVVILGDTCDASTMVPLAQDADVVVHEATNTLLFPLDEGKTYGIVEHDAIGHGHSTPLMAAAFAARVGAKMLVLNHFSARYRGDPSTESVAAMMRIEMQAMRAGGLERHQVVAAWDFVQVPVLSRDSWDAHRSKAREEDDAHAAALLNRALEWKARQEREQGGGDKRATEDAPGTSPIGRSGDGDWRGAQGVVAGGNQASSRRSHRYPSASGSGKAEGVAMSVNLRKGEHYVGYEAVGASGETRLLSRVTARLEAMGGPSGLEDEVEGVEGTGSSETRRGRKVEKTPGR